MLIIHYLENDNTYCVIFLDPKNPDGKNMHFIYNANNKIHLYDI